MKSFLAVVTYNRLACLKQAISGLKKTDIPLGIFEDYGHEDGTRDFLQQGGTGELQPHLHAVRNGGLRANTWAFLGTCNAGVAGNSNRAIRWAMDEGCDHLVLANDDVNLTDGIVQKYAEAHQKTGVGVFCSEGWITEGEQLFVHNGIELKELRCLPGKLVSMTRKAVEAIGYFDTRFGKFGEEYRDFAIRARCSGLIRIENKDYHALDVHHGLAKAQQDTLSSVGFARKCLLKEAEVEMQATIHKYPFMNPYRAFSLVKFKTDIGGNYGRIASPKAVEPCPWE